jgi:hypothetical protein
LRAGCRLLLLLLLHKLRLSLLSLLDLTTMLLLRGRQGRRLQHGGTQPLIGWGSCRLLRIKIIPLLLPLLQAHTVGGPAATVHGVDGCQTHNTPQPLVHGWPRSTPSPWRWLRATHAQHMVRLQCTRHPPNKLLLHDANNSLRHRALPKMVPAPRLATLHRTTHTLPISHVHALCSGQTIEHKTPKHLLEVIVPPQLPQRLVGRNHSSTTHCHLCWVAPHSQWGNGINKITPVLRAHLNQRAKLQRSSLLHRQAGHRHTGAPKAPPQASNQPTLHTQLAV